MSTDNQAASTTVGDPVLNNVVSGASIEDATTVSPTETDQSTAASSTSTSSSKLSSTAAPFNPFSAASLSAGPAPLSTNPSTDPPRSALGAVVPRRPEKPSNPVYVKNTFLEAEASCAAEGSSSLTVDAAAACRSRTESCDAVLEGSRRHKLSLVPPETVHEANDDYHEALEDDSRGFLGTSDDVTDTEGRFLTTSIDQEVEALRSRFTSGAGPSEMYEKLLQLQAQSRVLAANFHKESVDTLYDYALYAPHHHNMNTTPNNDSPCGPPSLISPPTSNYPSESVGGTSSPGSIHPQQYDPSIVNPAEVDPSAALATAMAGLPPGTKLINGHLPMTNLLSSENTPQIPAASPSSSPPFHPHDHINEQPQQLPTQHPSYPFYDTNENIPQSQHASPISRPHESPPHHSYNQHPQYMGSSPRHHPHNPNSRVHNNKGRNFHQQYNDGNGGYHHRQRTSDYSDNSDNYGDLMGMGDHHTGSPLGHPSNPSSPSAGHPQRSPLPPGRPLPPEELPENTGMTTIMLRNIPNKYTQKMLLDVINQHFSGLYDFFYLPIDFRNKCNVGYAFINFIHSHYAVMFKEQYDGLKLGAFKSNKVCEVSWGRVQGLQANIEHYRNSAVMSIPVPQYKPMLFKNGVIVPFPLADGPLPSVKLRPQKC